MPHCLSFSLEDNLRIELDQPRVNRSTSSVCAANFHDTVNAVYNSQYDTRIANDILRAPSILSMRLHPSHNRSLTLAIQAYLLLVLPLLTDSSPIPSILPTKIQVEIIPVIPFWAVVSLGAYLLGRLGFGVLQFNDTKAAYTELMQQIDTAKKDLDVRNVGWD